MRDGWQVLEFHGDMQVVPVADLLPHTWPMCWCRPVQRSMATKHGPSIMYSHNALDGRM